VGYAAVVRGGGAYDPVRDLGELLHLRLGQRSKTSRLTS